MDGKVRGGTIFLGVLAIIAVGVVAYLAKVVIIPLVIAVLVFFILDPFIRVLRNLRVPRTVAVILAIMLFLGFFFLIGLFLFNTAQSFLESSEEYLNKMNNIFQDINTKYLTRFDIPADFVENFDWTDTLKQYIFSWSGSVLRTLSVFAIIVLYMIFLFVESPRFNKRVQRAFPLHTAHRIAIIMEHINRQISRYLSVKFIVSSGTGILVFSALSLIGMDFPLLWAALAFFMNFIPNIGSVISALVTILAGIIQFYPQAGMSVIVAIAVIVIQIGMGSFLDPLLQGERLDLSPVVILFSLIFWGWLWGVIGAILAVPLTATLRIVMTNIPFLKSVGIMIGGGGKKRRRRRKHQ